MHTVMIITAGLILFAILALMTRKIEPLRPHYFFAFTVLWFVGAAINMGVGIAHAGYSFMAELPIFFVVFLVPVIVAGLIKRKLP
ncbi:hypothetical protein [Alcanivorax sp.]|jgi:hypothetical protein|uniref:hypothetical protein n=1 Tax=Alcanivorax sp. TaxID=1872427 RepID=UPI0032D98DF4